MVLVPAGSYLSGSDKFVDERPSGDIYLDAFFIDRFEVTQKEFKKVTVDMKKNKSFILYHKTLLNQKIHYSMCIALQDQKT